MDREEAIKILKDTLYDEKTPTDYLEAVKMGREALENQKTGHWVVYSELTGEWEGTKKYACDKCGEKVGVFKSNFCPNCGAIMKGENNENTDRPR